MNVLINSLFSNQYINYVKAKLVVLSPENKKIAMFAAAAFALLTVTLGHLAYRSFQHCFTAKNLGKPVNKIQGSVEDNKGKQTAGGNEGSSQAGKNVEADSTNTGEPNKPGEIGEANLPIKNEPVSTNNNGSKEPVVKSKKPISLKLKDNLDLARQQQGLEKSKPFTLTSGAIPEDIFNRPLRGEAKTVNGNKVGIASCQGIRSGMEDTDIAEPITFTVKGKEYHASVFGVFDGHGGTQASKFVQAHARDYLTELLEQNNSEVLTQEGIFNALKASFRNLDQDFDQENNTAGTTATLAMILDNRVWAANVGDARTVLSNDGVATQLSEDQKPDMPRYRKKIEKLGGFISKGQYSHIDHAPFRVNGILAVARAIGDKNMRGYKKVPGDSNDPNDFHDEPTDKCCISPDPKTTCYNLVDSNLKPLVTNGFLILACDGLYDVASTNQVVEAVNKLAKEGESEENIAKRLVWSALESKSTDNVTVIVVRLPNMR